MKRSMITVLSVGVVLSLAAVSQGNVVYQGDFTGVDLAIAGLVASPGAAGGTWTLNTGADRVDGVGGGNARSNVSTTNSWQHDGGFTLEVTFRTTAAMTRFSFGIVDAAYTISGSGDWLNSSLTGAYGIGFSTAGSGPSDYLGFNNDAGTVTVLSTAQGDATVGTAWQTMSITVTPNTWSYSLNGAPATTGTFSTPFDTSRSYVFTAHAHRNSNAQFTKIKLREVPAVYQSVFSGTTLASAGLAVSPAAAGGGWAIDDPSDQLVGVGGGNARASVYTTGSWQNNGGFKLDVTFWGSSALFRHSFGLVDANFNIAGTSSDWLNQSLAGAYGIGFSTAGSGPGTDYLGFNNDAGTVTVLSTNQGNKTSAAAETMTIIATPTSWSYSLNGAAATTGSHTFDTSRSYRFIAYAQSANRANFQNITISPIRTVWDGSTDTNWSADPDNTSWDRGIDTIYNDGDDVDFTCAGSTVNITGAVSPGSVSVNDGGTDYNFTDGGGSIGGTGTLTKDGTGTLTINTANTYSGGTIILGGTLDFRHNDSLGTGRIDLGQVGVLAFGVDALDLSEAVRAQNDAGNRTIRLDLAGANTGTLSGQLDIRLDDPGDFDIDVGTDDTLTVSGNVVTGAGGGAGLTKLGAGTLTLSSANTYSGDTTIDGGVLLLASGGSLDTATTVRINSPGTMQLDVNQTVDKLYLDGDLKLSGTWGATGSGADTIDDTHFSGTGILTVSNGAATTLFRFL
jgi:fibronectin-binding autotransporter adhesin